jgi:hypothetical protein
MENEEWSFGKGIVLIVLIGLALMAGGVMG